VPLYELSVRSDLEARLFPVRSGDDLVVPAAISVAFSFYPNDLTTGHLLVDCLLYRGGKRLELDRLTRLLPSLRLSKNLSC